MLRDRSCGIIVVCGLLLLPIGAKAAAGQSLSQSVTDKHALTLWPHGAPGSLPNRATGPEISTSQAPLVAGKTVERLANVSTPTITLYSPVGKNTGTAVVVFPGGGWRILAMDLEGTEICQWLNSVGVNCILLKYRVPDSGPYPKSTAAVQDAQRALGVVREHAVEWHIDLHRVGVLGFSAGGNLAAALSTHFEQRLYDPVDDADKLSCRPDFAVLIYPGALHESGDLLALDPNLQPTADTPPTFLSQAENDPVHVENSVDYFLALKNAKVPAEMHLYAQGRHGFGLRRTALPITTWPASVVLWLHTIHMLPAETP